MSENNQVVPVGDRSTWASTRVTDTVLVVRQGAFGVIRIG